MNIYHAERTMEATNAYAVAVSAYNSLILDIEKRSSDFQSQIASQVAAVKEKLRTAEELLSRYSVDPETTDEQWQVLVTGCNALADICSSADAKVRAAAGGDVVIKALKDAQDALSGLNIFPWWLTAGLALGLGVYVYSKLK